MISEAAEPGRLLDRAPALAEASLVWVGRNPHKGLLLAGFGTTRLHIDYVFMPEEWSTCAFDLTVGPYEEWIGPGLSDHVPLVLEITPPQCATQSCREIASDGVARMDGASTWIPRKSTLGPDRGPL